MAVPDAVRNPEFTQDFADNKHHTDTPELRRKRIRTWISRRLKEIAVSPNEKGNVKVAALGMLADLHGVKASQVRVQSPATTNVMLASGTGSVDTLVAKLSDALVAKLPSSSDDPSNDR